MTQVIRIRLSAVKARIRLRMLRVSFQTSRISSAGLGTMTISVGAAPGLPRRRRYSVCAGVISFANHLGTVSSVVSGFRKVGWIIVPSGRSTAILRWRVRSRSCRWRINICCDVCGIVRLGADNGGRQELQGMFGARFCFMRHRLPGGIDCDVCTRHQHGKHNGQDKQDQS